MKKLLLLLLIISQYVCAQHIDDNNIIWTVTNSAGNYTATYDDIYGIIISDSIVDLKIKPDSDSDYWQCFINNKAKERVVVKWKESVMNNSRLIFADIMKFQLSNEIPDGFIYNNGELFKRIMSEFNFEHNGLVDVKGLKKAYKKNKMPSHSYINISIPIEYEGNTKIFSIDFEGEYRGRL